MSDEIARRATDLGEVAVLDILRNLEVAGKITPISLDLDEPDLDRDRFLDLCAYFGALRNATAWWVGDLLNLGDFLHGFEASQAEAVLGREPETLRRWQWVATNVQRSRRNPRLSFSHHEVVATLPPAEQTAWLDRAEEDRLRVHELRSHVKASCSTSNKVECSTVEHSASGSPESADPDSPPGPTATSASREAAAGAVEEAARDVLAAGRRHGAVVEVPGSIFDRLALALGEPTPGQLPIVEVTPDPKRKGPE